MKKFIALLLLAILLLSFSGCERKQAQVPNENAKIVKFDSEPEGAEVFIDDSMKGTTPCDIKLSFGKHYIRLKKDGYESYVSEDAEIGKNTNVIKAKLRKISEITPINLTENSRVNALLSAPSKIFFVSNGALYISDANGKTAEKIAVADRDFTIELYGTSPTGKWLFLDVITKDYFVIDRQYLYALNLENLDLVKITEDFCFENAIDISFGLGEDKIILGTRSVNAPYSPVEVFNLNTKKFSCLLDCTTKSKYEKAYEFHISPDGKYIAYAGGDVEVFPDNRTALYIKNIETGKLKMLVKPSNFNQNDKTDFIFDVHFVSSGKKIFYSRRIDPAKGKSVIKYFVTDLEGNSREITEEEALKLVPYDHYLLEGKLKKLLNKSLYIDAVLKKCGKIVFTAYDEKKGSEKLYICDTDFSHILETGISNPNFMEFSDSCKFTCQVLEEKDWYLIDAKTGAKTSLGELLGRKIDDAIFVSSE
jgi:hypothetical protein